MTEFAKKYISSRWAPHISIDCTCFILYDKQNFSCSAEIRVQQDLPGHSAIKCQLFIFCSECYEYAVGQKVESIKTFVQLGELLDTFSDQVICKGITDIQLKEVFSKLYKPSKGTFCHWSQSVRSVKCKNIPSLIKCLECYRYEQSLKTSRRKGMKMTRNTHKKCNNRYLTKEAIAIKAKSCTVERTLLVRKVRRLKKQMEQLVQSGDIINREDNEDLLHLLSAAKSNIDNNSSLGMLLSAQLKAAKRKSCRGFTWHPVLIKWCLYIYKMSACTYRALRGSGFLILPSECRILPSSS